jgi:hypothetical protein
MEVEMETSRKNIAEVLSDNHREFMRSYIEREEQASKAALERFLALRLKVSGRE